MLTLNLVSLMTGSDETEPHPLDQRNKLKDAKVSPTSWTKLYLQLEKNNLS